MRAFNNQFNICMSSHPMNNSFLRALDTNLKYSGLVTLAMNLSKERNVYDVTNQLAEVEGVRLQKNYSVVILRVAYLLKNKLKTLEEIFRHLELNYFKCIEQKFQKSLSKTEIQIVQEKCEYDISVFKRAFIQADDDQDEASQIFISLYCDSLNKASATARQQKEARRLAKIMVGVFSNREQNPIDGSTRVNKSIEISNDASTEKNSCFRELALLRGQDQSHSTQQGDLQESHKTLQKKEIKVEEMLPTSENSPEPSSIMNEELPELVSSIQRKKKSSIGRISTLLSRLFIPNQLVS